MIGIGSAARAVLAVALVFACLPSAQAEDAMTPDRKKTIEGLVKQYILDHPEVLIESMRRMEQKRKDAENAKIAHTIKSRRKEIFDNGDPFAGPASGDVVLVEFFDYQCGVCKRVLPIIQKVLLTDHKVRLVYKDWPILGPNSVVAAQAALASHKQGKYVAFHNAMMATTGRLTKQRILAVAKRVGLDPVKLEKDMKSREVTATLSRNLKLADSLSLSGTPSFVMGNSLIRGGLPFSAMMAKIAEERKRTKDGS